MPVSRKTNRNPEMDKLEGRIKRIINDIAYLVDELQALGYVIDSVPVHEKPPGSQSVYEMFALIDHAQVNHYKLLLNKMLAYKDGDIEAGNYEKTFAPNASDDNNVHELLSEISANRNNLLTKLNELETAAWLTQGSINGQGYTVIDLMEEMVDFERNQLREIAERVLALESKKPENN
jgi:hypothetical protein